ncbi:MAG: AraC family transcriptional regulator [Verrucomicrobiales bacterium]|nr:AraC family transcriptional regulator [Verrucomicrobiales bacterium]
MTVQAAKSFRDAFFARNETIFGLIEIISRVPGLCVYVKDLDSRYVYNNEAHRVNYNRIAWNELIGKRASEFFPPLLGEAYEANDRKVFETVEPIENEIWLVPTIRGTPGWFISNKTPLFSITNELIGLLGILSPIATPEDQLIHFGDLQKVIEFIDTNYVDEITAEKLAEIAGLSIPQFNRRFRQLLRLSPMDYVFSLRIQRAQQLLSTTKRTIGDIAAATGFYDQSHFSKRFKQITGITPLAYRKGYF